MTEANNREVDFFCSTQDTTQDNTQDPAQFIRELYHGILICVKNQMLDMVFISRFSDVGIAPWLISCENIYTASQIRSVKSVDVQNASCCEHDAKDVRKST